jgi:hypothetical protein
VPGDTEITSAATTGRTGAEATDAAAVSAATRFRSGTNPSVDWRTPLRM